jgi:hypothetical protein
MILVSVPAGRSGLKLANGLGARSQCQKLSPSVTHGSGQQALAFGTWYKYILASEGPISSPLSKRSQPRKDLFCRNRIPKAPERTCSNRTCTFCRRKCRAEGSPSHRRSRTGALGPTAARTGAQVKQVDETGPCQLLRFAKKHRRFQSLLAQRHDLGCDLSELRQRIDHQIFVADNV